MTQETPPGWYPDPGQKSDGPATERWWDGRTWTDRVRPGRPPTAGLPPTAAQPGPEEARGEGTAPGAEGARGDDTAALPRDPADGTAALPRDPADGTAALPRDPAQETGSAGAEHAASAFGPAASPAAPGFPPGPGHPGGAAHPAAHPAYPAYPSAPPSGRGRRLRTGIAVGVAVVVLASIGVGVQALTDDGGGGAATSQGPGGPDAPGGRGGPFGGSGGGGGDGGRSPKPDRSEPPKIRGGSVTDRVSGISLPIPKGWYGLQLNAGAQVMSDESYKCPGDTSATCTEGGAYSAPALALGTRGDTPEEIAKADIADNAEESYGGKSYGGITSHDVLASRAVTVAGQKGFLVRWKAVTRKGADGIVESLVFPSPANSRQMVVVRFGVDAGRQESVLDTIAQGIEASTGGGNGQDV
ncbi:DUF2510 domain-containing protein [Streptomyces sp. NPDC058735]|uniref:DUF2510 domain-containing protein n=1 Tax=unclassified Streptomyces TaxID=2593676 RepID=UPI00369D43D6